MTVLADQNLLRSGLLIRLKDISQKPAVGEPHTRYWFENQQQAWFYDAINGPGWIQDFQVPQEHAQPGDVFQGFK